MSKTHLVEPPAGPALRHARHVPNRLRVRDRRWIVAPLSLALAAATVTAPAVARWRSPVESTVHGRVGAIGVPGADVARRGTDLVLTPRAGDGLPPDWYSVVATDQQGSQDVVCRHVTVDPCVDTMPPAASGRRYVITAHRGHSWTRSSPIVSAYTAPPDPILALAPTTSEKTPQVLVVARPGAEDYSIVLSVDGTRVETSRWIVHPADADTRTAALPALSPGPHVIRAEADFHDTAVSSNQLILNTGDDGTVTDASGETEPGLNNPGEQPGTLIDINHNGVIDSGDIFAPAPRYVRQLLALCPPPPSEPAPSSTADADQGSTASSDTRTRDPGQPMPVAVTVSPHDSEDSSGPRRVHLSIVPAMGTCTRNPTTIDLGEITITATVPQARATFADSRLAIDEATGVATLTLGSNPTDKA